jgi:hypothetical protein
VVKLKRVKRFRLAEYCSMSRSRPERVVASAAALTSSRCSVSQAPNRPGLAGAREHERGRALHRVVQDGGGHAARLAEQAHAAVVARDERALRGRERHVELALRMLAVDEQRAGDPDRDLRHADELLDVARQQRRVERVRRDVVELRARALVQERPPAAAIWSV